MVKPASSLRLIVSDRDYQHLQAVFLRGMLDGVSFRHPRRREETVSKAAIARYALELAAKYAVETSPQATPALPEKTSGVDADRLKAARGTMSTKECANAAGLADGASVRNVENKGMPLRGALLAWVESVEAGR